MFSETSHFKHISFPRCTVWSVRGVKTFRGFTTEKKDNYRSQTQTPERPRWFLVLKMKMCSGAIDMLGGNWNTTKILFLMMHDLIHEKEKTASS